MKKLKEIKIGERFWVPKRGIVKKTSDKYYKGTDGILNAASVQNLHGVFHYFSLEWWEENKQFFDITKFKKFDTIFTFDGQIETIQKIDKSFDEVLLYNNVKCFECFSKKINNFNWFTNIHNMEDSYYVHLSNYLNINFQHLPTEYIKIHPEIRKFADHVVHYKSARSINKVLIPEE